MSDSIFSMRKILIILAIVFLAMAIPITLYLLNQQQDIRQRAAGQADLIVSGVQLTDAAGNVRTKFGVNEDIYVKIRIKNQGTDTGVSTDGKTYTQFYSHKPSTVSPNEGSTDGISLTNGQFSAGYEKTYESRWNGLNNSFYKQNIYFNKSNDGNYTARVYVNYDGKVTETNYLNNQATIQYTVTKNFVSQGIYRAGTDSASAPSGFSASNCGEQGTNNGVTACYMLEPVNGRSIVRFTNNSSGSRAVGGAVYQSYYRFPDPYPSCSPSECPEQYIWAWTQTIYAAHTMTLSSGETRYISLPIPDCYWQVDAFIGSEIFLSFHPPSQTYGRSGRLIGGGWLEQYGSLEACKPNDIPFPSVTPTITPTATLTPTLPPEVPTPTNTPTETPTPIPPSETPTPTIPACPLPSQVQNVRIECPFCGQ